MKKVILICHGGQSTSIMARSVRDLSDGEVDIQAFSINQYQNHLDNVKVVLVAPQIKFLIPDIRKNVSEDISVIPIEPRVYGLMDSEAILKVINEAYGVQEIVC